jgi:uncharacterized delta-60 repeat protein
MMNTAYVVLVLLSLFIHPITGQHGELDSTFNGNGKATIDFLDYIDIATAAVLQTDGKIVIAGYVDLGPLEEFGVTRVNTDGTIDNSFGINGKVITDVGPSNARAHAVAIQADGKILVAGSANAFVLARYHPEGVIDSTFGINGIQTERFDSIDFFAHCTSMAIQADGKIILAGHSSSQAVDFALVRYHPNGIIDTSFGTLGRITTDIGFTTDNGANAIAIQADGKIVAGGFTGNFPVGDFCLMRYTTDGSLDSTFNMDGKVTTSISQFADNLTALVIQPDGKIIAAGHTNSGDPYHWNFDFTLTRYNENGSLDSTFGTDGKVITAFGPNNDGVNSVALQSDGKIVAIGYTTNLQDRDFAVARYHADGTPDTSWGNYGILTTSFSSIADYGNAVVMQTDGKIVVIGSAVTASSSDFAIARYLPGIIIGTIEPSVVQDVLFYPNPVHEMEILEYTLMQDENVTIALFDISGRLSKLFVSQANRSKGIHRESLWFGDDLVPGTYLLRISTNSGSSTIKILKS